MKVVSIVGARPEFIQAFPVTRALRQRHREVLVHTGQHYDYRMSKLFFDELGLPEPDYHLGAGSGTHAEQTSAMLVLLEQVLLSEQPDWVVIRGDTNSTLAGALAAAKLGLPVAHIESGARSYRRDMPEEINRLVADRLASLLFCIAPSGVDNLAAEGIRNGVHYVGDVMFDAVLLCLERARQRSGILARLGLEPGGYLLATVHRAANTDRPERLGGIVAGLNALRERVVFPMHPRLRKAMQAEGLKLGQHVIGLEPLGYFDMLTLESEARLILTDSGGVTREAYFLSVPCVTLREETEHVETVRVGWNVLVGTDPERIVAAVERFCPRGLQPQIFGDGQAACRIVELIEGVPSRALTPLAVGAC